MHVGVVFWSDSFRGSNGGNTPWYDPHCQF